jgi:hypothetical protein
MSWEGYVRLAFDELRLAGAGSPQVARRLRAVLEDLGTVASPERQPPLDRELKLLDDGVRRAFDDDADVDAALVPDMQGIGSGSDVMSHPPPSASPRARDTRLPLADPAGARTASAARAKHDSRAALPDFRLRLQATASRAGCRVCCSYVKRHRRSPAGNARSPAGRPAAPL